MTREGAAIDPELFYAESVILSCRTAAFTGSKQAARRVHRPGAQQVG